MDLRARIATLAAAEPALADELALRGTIIELVDRADIGSVEVRVPGDLVRARLAAGRPLLDRLDLPVPPAVAALIERLAVAMLVDPASRVAAEAIIAALQAHRLHAEQLISEAIVGHADHLAALADGAGVPTDLIATLADLASRPLLAEIARRLRPALALVPWGHGYCPVCGGRPVFAEGDALTDASITLRCGRCAVGWAWSLPDCPDCRTGHLTMLDAPAAPAPPAAAETSHWRLLACESSRTYLKLTGLPRAAGLADLLLADLESWPLDREALGQGLGRSAEPAVRLEHGEPPPQLLDDGPDDD